MGKPKILEMATYSTEEVKTGEYWIDGKPIYRKVITITPTTTDQIVVNHNIANVDKIWLSNKSFLDIDGVGLPVNYYRNADTFIWAHVSIDNCQCKVSAPGWLNKTMYFVVEYTKTTD